MTFDALVQSSRDYYEAALKKFGDSPAGVNWRDAETQTLRFDVLRSIGDLHNRRIHDVGCGLAHFQDYLTANTAGCAYVGSDISEDMINTARARLDRAEELHCANLLTTDESWMKADYVVNSGLFTVRGETSRDEWWDFVKAMTSRMFELSSLGIGFNLMTSHVDYRDDHLFYLDPGEALAFCAENLSRKVVIRHDYPLWEYMVFVYR
jgi:SAM-dependent methyltransferase